MSSSILQAVIDGLTANIAVLDRSGTIVAVNRSWSGFAESNGLRLANHGVGSNYLAVCDAAASIEAARTIGDAIRMVLAGESERFDLRFQSRDPDADRWNRIAITRAAETPEPLAIVSHQIVDETIGSRSVLDFEDLVAELSAAFVASPAGEVDSQIDYWLERIVRELDLDRAAIAEIDPEDHQFLVTHQWTRAGMRPVPIGMNANRALPWVISRVLAGKVTVISGEGDIPPEGNIDRATGRNLNFKSNVLIPLRGGNAIIGGFACGTLAKHRNWSPRIVQRLQTVARIFSNALERKRSQQGMRKLQHEVHELSRVTLMGELTASLAHELNQPLGAILNNAQAARRLLHARKLDLNEIRGAVDAIIRDDERATETIRNVRELFKPAPDRLVDAEVGHLVGDAARIVREDARIRGISLRIEIPATLPRIRCDRTQIIQVLMNLLLNAFDAIMADGGDPREVTIGADHRDAGNLTLLVIDSGSGIPAEALPRIFDPFFTTRTHGMGMGLAISKSIIENHGGEIRAHGNRGRGTTVEFTLPVAQESGLG